MSKDQGDMRGREHGFVSDLTDGEQILSLGELEVALGQKEFEKFTDFGPDSSHEELESFLEELDPESVLVEWNEQVDDDPYLHFILTELAANRLDVEEKTRAYLHCLEKEPTFRGAIWGLRRQFTQRGDWPRVLRLIDAEIQITRNENRLAELYCERGEVLLYHQDELNGAQEAFLECVKRDKEHIRALWGLEHCGRRARNSEQVWKWGKKIGELLAPRELAAQYWGELAGGLFALGGYDHASSAVLQSMTLSTRETAYMPLFLDCVECLESEQEKVLFLRRGLDCLKNRDCEAGSLREIWCDYLMIRQLHLLKNINEETAWEALRQFACEREVSSLTQKQLSLIADEIGKYGEWNELARERGVSIEHEQEQLLLLQRAEAKFNEGDMIAVGMLVEKLGSSNPGETSLVSLRERIAASQGNWAELAACYEDFADAALLGEFIDGQALTKPSRSGAAAHYVLAGQLYWEYVGDLEGAERCLQRALEAIEGYLPGLESLVQLWMGQGRHAEAVDLLIRYSHLGDKEQRLRLLLWADSICFGKLRREGGDGSLREKRLEIGRELHRAGGEIQTALTLATMSAESGRSEEEMKWREQLGRAQITSAPGQAQLFLVAQYYEENLDTSRAKELLQVILEENIQHPHAQAAYIRILHGEGNWREAADFFRRIAETTENSRTRRKWLGQAAQSLSRASEHRSAARLFRKILEENPKDQEALLGLLDNLQEESAELIDALARFVGEIRQPQLRRFLCIRLAIANERVGAHKRAIAALLSVLDSTSEVPLAAAFLFELSAVHGEKDVAADALLKLADSQGMSAKTRNVFQEAAAWYSLVYDDLEKSKEVFEGMIRQVPDCQSAWLGLACVASRRGLYQERNSALRRLEALLPEGTTKRLLNIRLARWGFDANEPLEAMGALLRAYNGAAESRAVARVVVEYATACVERVDDIAGAEEMLVTSFQKVIEGAEGANKNDWRIRFAQILLRLGRLREAGAQAIEILNKSAREIRAWVVLAEAAKLSGNTVLFAQTTNYLSQNLQSNSAKKLLLESSADSFDRLLDEESALDVYCDLLRVAPSSQYALKVVTLCQLLGRQETLVRTIDSSVLAGLDAATLPQVLLERAKANLQLGKRRAAEEDIRRVLDRVDVPVQAWLTVGKLHYEQREWDEASAALQKYLDSGEETERLHARTMLANCYLQTGRAEQAIAPLQAAVEFAPAEFGISKMLRIAFERLGDWDGALQEMLRFEEVSKSHTEREQTIETIVDLLLSRVPNLEKRKSTLRLLWQKHASNITLRTALVEHCGEVEKKAVLSTSVAKLRQAIAEDATSVFLHESLHDCYLASDDSAGLLCSELTLRTLRNEQPTARVFKAGIAQSGFPSLSKLEGPRTLWRAWVKESDGFLMGGERVSRKKSSTELSSASPIGRQLHDFSVNCTVLFTDAELPFSMHGKKGPVLVVPKDWEEGVPSGSSAFHLALACAEIRYEVVALSRLSKTAWSRFFEALRSATDSSWLETVTAGKKHRQRLHELVGGVKLEDVKRWFVSEQESLCGIAALYSRDLSSAFVGSEKGRLGRVCAWVHSSDAYEFAKGLIS